MKFGPIGDAAAATPDAIALADEHREVTWAGLIAETSAVAAAFVSLAPDDDQRIGVLGENRVETVIAHLAGILTGVGTVALSRQLTAGELADQLADARATAVVAGPTSTSSASAAAEQTGVRLIVHNAAPSAAQSAWAELAAGEALTTDVAATRPPRPPIVYTSGTTGRARGTEVRWLPRTFETAADYAAALAAKRSFPPGPHLVVGPLQHNGPLTALRHLVAGNPLIVLEKFDAERLLALIARYRVTSAVMVPTHFSRLLALDVERRAAYDLSSVVSIAHTGSACPPAVKRAMIEWWGPVLVESYGGSEIGTVCRIDSTDWLAHPGSVGRTVDPFEVVVVGEDGAELPSGEVGVLGFRTPPGYGVEFHGDPEKTAKAHLAPGVATLGDVGYVDADGFVYITDRVADMVISGGVNLYPAEIERVLQDHEAVAEVAVIGVAHQDLGETLLALVVAQPSVEHPTDEALVAYLKTSLAAYKVPRRFEWVAELPRNAMGKVDKKLLRATHGPGENPK